eukprot:CAMPEP_0167792360 /NCGR_PEP_ID=MMETSP0111_2-20121227/12520_1 /TAXON_ID=91324 /ORGANISM="Lotharella globosa, Strain CCCM811" /LENGTH=281 /DNA_ID=CAMNT_0007685275 /DNA_START=35 /DNA_END=881 /DNA_ORIENTATION=-
MTCGDSFCHGSAIIFSISALFIGSISLGGTHTTDLAWGYGRYRLTGENGCENTFYLGLNYYQIKSKGDCDDLTDNNGSTDGGAFTNTDACNQDFWGEASNALCRGCATAGQIIPVFVTLAMFCLMVSAFTSCIRLALSDVGGSKCLYLWNSYLLITSAVLMLLRCTSCRIMQVLVHRDLWLNVNPPHACVVVWITSCQNNFVSYLDTIGQTPELMNRVTLWSRYIEVGCILAIVSTGLAYIAYGMETCILNPVSLEEKMEMEVEMRKRQQQEEQKRDTAEV